MILGSGGTSELCVCLIAENPGLPSRSGFRFPSRIRITENGFWWIRHDPIQRGQTVGDRRAKRLSWFPLLHCTDGLWKQFLGWDRSWFKNIFVTRDPKIPADPGQDICPRYHRGQSFPEIGGLKGTCKGGVLGCNKLGGPRSSSPHLFRVAIVEEQMFHRRNINL